MATCNIATYSDLSKLLAIEYGIITDTIAPATRGFSEKAAYHEKSMEYYVKVYDKSLPTTRYFVDSKA